MTASMLGFVRGSDYAITDVHFYNAKGEDLGKATFQYRSRYSYGGDVYYTTESAYVESDVIQNATSIKFCPHG